MWLESTQFFFQAAKKGIKIQVFFWTKKKNINHGYKEEAKMWMKKPKLDEIRTKIGDFFNLHLYCG
jgi:hypothetical protein